MGEKGDRLWVRETNGEMEWQEGVIETESLTSGIPPRDSTIVTLLEQLTARSSCTAVFKGEVWSRAHCSLTLHLARGTIYKSKRECEEDCPVVYKMYSLVGKLRKAVNIEVMFKFNSNTLRLHKYEDAKAPVCSCVYKHPQQHLLCDQHSFH